MINNYYLCISYYFVIIFVVPNNGICVSVLWGERLMIRVNNLTVLNSSTDAVAYTPWSLELYRYNFHAYII